MNGNGRCRCGPFNQNWAAGVGLALLCSAMPAGPGVARRTVASIVRSHARFARNCYFHGLRPHKLTRGDGRLHEVARGEPCATSRCTRFISTRVMQGAESLIFYSHKVLYWIFHAQYVKYCNWMKRFSRYFFQLSFQIPPWNKKVYKNGSQIKTKKICTSLKKKYFVKIRDMQSFNESNHTWNVWLLLKL